jgi:hypothetical protein
MAPSSGICDMCGHQVMNRQKAHIVAEGKKRAPTCSCSVPPATSCLIPTSSLVSTIADLSPAVVKHLGQLMADPKGRKGSPQCWHS